MILTTQSLELPCGKCRRSVQAEIIEPKLLNGRGVSTIVVVHDVTVECPHCHATMALRLAGAQGYMFQLVEVNPSPQSSRIHIPNGFGG